MSDLGRVVPNSVGKVQNYSNIYNRVFKPMLVKNRIVDEAGDAKFGIHGLRHAAASLFIEQGWNPKKIQTLLGHASITTTREFYLQAADANGRDALARYATLLDALAEETCVKHAYESTSPPQADVGECGSNVQ